MKLMTDGRRTLEARTDALAPGGGDVYGPLVLRLDDEPTALWWAWFPAGTCLQLDGVAAEDAEVEIDLLDERFLPIARAQRVGQRLGCAARLATDGVVYLRAARRADGTGPAVVALRLEATRTARERLPRRGLVARLLARSA